METKTLSRLESIKMEKGPRHVGFETKRVYFRRTITAKPRILAVMQTQLLTMLKPVGGLIAGVGAR